LSGTGTHHHPDPNEDALLAVLERARERGYLGPGAVRPHLVHARGFAAVAVRALGRTPDRVVDLGSGGGVPGLVLAAAWPDARVTLVEAGRRRAAGLVAAATELFGPGDRVTVVEARAETFAHVPGQQEQATLVTARSLGPPALTAEIATGFLALGGWLVVSEPPEPDEDRWPTTPLARLGFGPVRLMSAGDAHYIAIPKIAPAPAGVPRETRPLVKRPAW
jgi:16S rRNA (guanine527-N7)-methyltransferase